MPSSSRQAQFSIVLVMGLVFCAAIVPAAQAQTYPARPIRMIVPFPPGGSNDIVARVIGQQLTERLGKPVVIDNRGGAGGLIGTETAIHAQPDGYTLLIISAAYSYNPSVYKLPYDPIKAIVPITLIGSGPTSLVVNPGVPVNSVRDLIALAKAKPGQLNYASAGIGSFIHLSTELFRIMAGINIVHVPFKGGGPAILDVLSGQTQITMGTLIQNIPHIRSGRLKLLGVGSSKRAAILPDAPTIAEAGVPGYEASNWWGIIAPAGTPTAIVKKLHAEIAAILTTPATRKWFASEGAEIFNLASEQFGKHIVAETAKWGRVVKEAGIKAN
jgi:tripartite-type tricarboxylate transporter receptor subunit TctC